MVAGGRQCFKRVVVDGSLEGWWMALAQKVAVDGGSEEGTTTCRPLTPRTTLRDVTANALVKNNGSLDKTHHSDLAPTVSKLFSRLQDFLRPLQASAPVPVVR
ncbi:hypothetical protein OSB04_un000052 [Centaurea solstitialis]|uniref:Uncharacterized protein n=1 Tax=Centaurea solstitialis TaxID=347529 RepID=A0AA38SDC5_9ASTR|nr:hypothetical protein OSB04_un000052 [Centaurea solstitialis]